MRDSDPISFEKLLSVKEEIYLFWKMLICKFKDFHIFLGSFPLVPSPAPTSLVGAYYLHPQHARAIFLDDDLLCNSTCSNWGAHNVLGGGTNGKDHIFETFVFIGIVLSYRF